MADALANLDSRIKGDLQWYLKKPVIERTQADYDLLTDRLTYAAMDYAKAMVQERLAAKRQAQQQVGKRR